MSEKKATVSSHSLNIQIIATCLLSFFFLSGYYMPGFGQSFNFVFTDHIFYGKLAAAMAKTGAELNAYDLYSQFEKGQIKFAPYHFLELWMTALFSECFGISTVQCFQLLVLPVFFGLSYAGLYSVWENKVTTFRPWHFIFVAFALIFTGLDSRWLGEILNKKIGLPYHILGIGNGKILPLLPFFLLASALVIRKKLMSGLMVLLLLSFLSVSALTFAVAFGILFVYHCIISHQINKKDAYILFIISTLLVCFFGGFYWFAGNTQADSSDTFALETGGKFRLRFLKETLFQFGVFSLAYLNIAFLAIWLIFRKKLSVNFWKYPEAIYLLSLAVAFVSGIGLWAFLPSLFDAFQFFWIPRTLILPLLVILAFQIVFLMKEKWFQTGFALMGILIFFNGITEHKLFQKNAHPSINTFLFNRLQQELHSDSIQFFGLLYHQKTTSVADHPFALRYFGQEPTMVNSHYFSFPLSILDDTVLLNLKPLQRVLSQNRLLIEKTRSIKNGENLSDNQIVARVVMQMKMPFVFCEDRNAMITELKSQVLDSLENPDNHNIIYFLKAD